MGRYLSAPATVCSCLAIATFALAMPSRVLAGHQVAQGASTHHPRGHRSADGRRRGHKAKRTAATRARARTTAKLGHTNAPMTSVPPSLATSAAPSPISGSFPPEPLSAQSPAPEEPANSQAPELPAKPSTPEEPKKTLASEESPKTPVPNEPTKATAPEEPTKAPTSEEPPQTPTPKEPAKTPTREAPAAKEPPPTKSRKLIWADEFNGPAGASPGPDWSFDTGGDGWDEQELQYYTSRAANAELNGQGDLAITARAEKYTGKDGVTRDYTSARLQTLEKFEFQYGLAEARIQVPAGQGLVGQFWMLGSEAYEQENWPACGEIDVAEVLGSEPNIVNGTLHAPWSWAPTGVQGQGESPTPLAAGFHTYSVEWEPERISFMLDGAVYKTVTPGDLPAGAAWPFKHPFFLLMDLTVGGEWSGPPSASTHFPAQMLVDWVRVWQ